MVVVVGGGGVVLVTVVVTALVGWRLLLFICMLGDIGGVGIGFNVNSECCGSSLFHHRN